MWGILSSLLFSVYFILRLIYWYGEALFRYFVVPPPLKSLDGETILVTGGAAGIGREICRALVQSSKELKLVIWDVNRRGALALAQDLEGCGGRGARVWVYEVDVSSKENIQKAAKLVKEDVGPVTVVVNNAGIARMGRFLELTDEDVESTMSINLSAHLWILREFLGDMMAANYGRIVNICSAAGLTAAHCGLPYFASKYGVNGCTEALKAELEYFGYDGIRVTTVFPTFVRTGIIKSLAFVDEETAKVAAPSSMKKLLEPDYVARKIVEGMRRELEFVYVPQVVAAFAYFECLFPMKQRKTTRAEWAKCMEYTDPEEKRIFEEGHWGQRR